MRYEKEIYGDAPVMLFGSRVDDSKRGGDVDLFIETSNPTSYQQRIDFLVKVERAGIERKVDLVVKSPNFPHEKIFDTAKRTGALL